jgi:hypothetical protein
MAFSSQANYTNREAEAYWRSYCKLLWVEGVMWSGQEVPMVVNLGFLDQNRYFSFK